MTFDQLITAQLAVRKGTTMTDQDLATLIVAAKVAKDAHAAVWADFRRVLKDYTDLDAKEQKAEFRRCRITADLGCYPYGVEEFVPAFLKSRGYAMKFTGDFGNSTDADFIFNQMSIWSHEIIGGAPVFTDSQIRAAFTNWQVQRKDAIVREHYALIAYDPAADKTELTRFAEFMTNKTGDAEVDAINARATEIAIQNFIYRVKNHMRGVWRHSIHMMPVFYGPQGSGKTTAVRHLLSPLEEVTSAVGFDVFEHDAKMFTLSVIPVMFFDELAGITKAENERLKDIIHTKQRELRQPYGRPVNRTLISTFIGCSNKEISTLIKDETGNRRYLQIDTPIKLARADILAFMPLVMWRSVDENADAPLYANDNDLAVVQSVQSVQRHMGNVEEWIENDITIPTYAVSAGDLFTDSFVPWLERMYPNQSRFENLTKFGKELNRLIVNQHPRLSKKHGKSKPLYTITPTAEVLEFRAKTDARLAKVRA